LLPHGPFAPQTLCGQDHANQPGRETLAVYPDMVGRRTKPSPVEPVHLSYCIVHSGRATPESSHQAYRVEKRKGQRGIALTRPTSSNCVLEWTSFWTPQVGVSHSPCDRLLNFCAGV
jgi:hypothetical protein